MYHETFRDQNFNLILEGGGWSHDMQEWMKLKYIRYLLTQSLYIIYCMTL